MAPSDRPITPRSELAALLGNEVPTALDELTDSEVGLLVAAIVDARRRHHEEVERAEAEVIGQVPLPLRGAVKRLMR